MESDQLLLFCFTCQWPWGFSIYTGEKVIENRNSNIFKRHLGCWIAMHLGKVDGSASDSAISAAGARSKHRQQKILCMLNFLQKNKKKFAFLICFCSISASK